MARKAPGDLSQKTEVMTERQRHVSNPVGQRSRIHWLRQLTGRMLAGTMLPALVVLAGCGGTLSSVSSSDSLSISPGTATIDTNCAGCNISTTSGGLVEQFTATLSGGAAGVNWTVSGGDANSGPGTITSSGQYTPPTYLTANSVSVTVTAALVSSPSTTASTTLTVTPGFLQPLTPENVALGANGAVTITGYIAEAGGTTGISYAVASSSTDRAADKDRWAVQAARAAATHSPIARSRIPLQLPLQPPHPPTWWRPSAPRLRKRRRKSC